MTTSRVTILLGAAIGLATLAGPSAGAIAADLNYGGSIKDTYAAPPSPGRTWYLRGFTGFSNYDSDAPTTELHDDTFESLSHEYESAPFLGFGLGVQVNHWLRFEGTAEYRGNATFHGLDRYDNGCPGGPAVCGTNEYTAVVESWVGLASAYADLFTWCGITPFVGVGIGVASVDVQGMKDVNVPANSVFSGSDNSEVNFAWAVHAGLAYEVNDKFTVDLGYRYMELGDASSGRMTAYDGSSSYASVDLDDLHSHDLMVGMRWKLDRPAPAYTAMK
jgi:opacity protein-like surface antigen